MEQRLGRYVVLGRIGKGAMAEVFAGRLDGPGGFSRRVAIKRIHPHLCQQPLVREMLTSEGRLAAVLEHADIVQVHEHRALFTGYLGLDELFARRPAEARVGLEAGA